MSWTKLNLSDVYDGSSNGGWKLVHTKLKLSSVSSFSLRINVFNMFLGKDILVLGNNSNKVLSQRLGNNKLCRIIVSTSKANTDLRTKF